MATYSMQCPAPGCDYKMTVTADDDTAAMSQIMAMGAEHGAAHHPEMKMTPEEMTELVKQNMVKEAE